MGHLSRSTAPGTAPLKNRRAIWSPLCRLPMGCPVVIGRCLPMVLQVPKKCLHPTKRNTDLQDWPKGPMGRYMCPMMPGALCSGSFIKNYSILNPIGKSITVLSMGFAFVWFISCKERKETDQETSEGVTAKTSVSVETETTTDLPAYMVEGEKVYTQHCLLCHQSNGCWSIGFEPAPEGH